MKLYFIVLLLVTLFLFFAEKNRKHKLLFNLNIFISSSILVLFAGTRSSNVGTDTNNYISIFNQINNDRVSDNNSSIEFFYLLLNKIAYFFSSDYSALLLSVAIVAVYFNMKVITKLSSNLWVSVFVFITLGSYVFFFNAARQGIAVALVGMAILQLHEKNIKKYIFWILIASLFHKTALVMIPIYFVNLNKFSIKKTVVIGLLFSVFIVFMSSFLNLLSGDISQRFSAYENRGASGGYTITFFYVLMTLLVVYFKKYISTGSLKKYNLYLNLCVVHTLVFIVVQITGVDINLIRLSNYFQLGFILIYPIVFKEVKIFNDIFPRIIFIGVHLLFYYVYLGKMSNLTPYFFNSIFNL